MSTKLRELHREDKINELKRYYAATMAESPTLDSTEFDDAVFDALEAVKRKFRIWSVHA